MDAPTPDPGRSTRSALSLALGALAVVAVGAGTLWRIRVGDWTEPELNAVFRATQGETLANTWTGTVHAPLQPLLLALTSWVEGEGYPLQTFVPYRAWNLPVALVGAVAAFRIAERLGAHSAAPAAVVLSFLGPLVLDQSGTATNYVFEASFAALAVAALLAFAEEDHHTGFTAALATGLAVSAGYMTVPALGPFVLHAIWTRGRRTGRARVLLFLTTLALATYPIWDRIRLGGLAILSASGLVTASEGSARAHVLFPVRPEQYPWSDFAFAATQQLGPVPWLVVLALGIAAGVGRPRAWLLVGAPLLVSVVGTWVYFVPHNLVVLAPLLGISVAVGVDTLAKGRDWLRAPFVLAAAGLVVASWQLGHERFLVEYERGLDERMALRRIAPRIPEHSTVVVAGPGTSHRASVLTWCIPRHSIRACMLGSVEASFRTKQVPLTRWTVLADTLWLPAPGPASERQELAEAIVRETGDAWFLRSAELRDPVREGLDAVADDRCRAVTSDGPWDLRRCDPPEP